jgi:hypothetical protein
LAAARRLLAWLVAHGAGNSKAEEGCQQYVRFLVLVQLRIALFDNSKVLTGIIVERNATAAQMKPILTHGRDSTREPRSCSGICGWNKR